MDGDAVVDRVQGGKPWSEEERRFVLENDARMTHAEIGAALQRRASAVRGLRAKLGLPRKAYVRDAGKPLVHLK